MPDQAVPGEILVLPASLGARFQPFVVQLPPPQVAVASRRLVGFDADGNVIFDQPLGPTLVSASPTPTGTSP
jgi:hypothetical protein